MEKLGFSIDMVVFSLLGWAWMMALVAVPVFFIVRALGRRVDRRLDAIERQLAALAERDVIG